MTHMRMPVFASVLIALAIVATNPTARAAKPRGGGAQLPNVRYQIQLWNMPHGAGGFINDMNNAGQVVGWELLEDGTKHAFLYDPHVDPTTAVDLNAIIVAPAGWTIASAVGINEAGVIVGYLEPDDSDGTIRSGYVLDTTAEFPGLEPLPDGEWGDTYPRDINDAGHILGVYRKPSGLHGVYFYNSAVDVVPVDLGVDLKSTAHLALNNPTAAHETQVALQLDGGTRSFGVPVRWTRGGGFESLPGTDTTVYDLNDSATVCGGTAARLGKGASGTYPYRYTTALEILASPAPGPALQINSSGDLHQGRYLYREGTGFLRLDDLIDRNDPDVELWFGVAGTYPSEMTDRIAGPEFPVFSGRHQLADGALVNYLLIPVSIP